MCVYLYISIGRQKKNNSNGSGSWHVNKPIHTGSEERNVLGLFSRHFFDDFVFFFGYKNKTIQFIKIGRQTVKFASQTLRKKQIPLKIAEIVVTQSAAVHPGLMVRTKI